MKNDFQKLYQKIIMQNQCKQIIQQGFLKNMLSAARQKVANVVNGDKGLYFNTGNQYSDCYQYLVALQGMYTNKVQGLRKPLANTITAVAKQMHAKKIKLGMSASQRVAADIVAAEQYVSKSIMQFKNQVTDTVKSVYKNMKQGVIQVIMGIYQTFKYAKNKVIDIFESTINGMKDLSQAVKKKLLANLQQLKNIAIQAGKFSKDVMFGIIKIIGTIAAISIGVLVLVVKGCINMQKQIMNYIAKKLKQAKKTGQEAVIAFYQQGKQNLGNLLQAAGSKLSQLGSQVKNA